jgi:DNA repair exonuclease SbcCD nuclease subunit
MSDVHAGYTRGTRESEGVNVRETDVLAAASLAIGNLIEAGVEAIVDLGDLFHVPAPKKRAILHMVRAINDSGLPFYSVNGNHTLVRTRSDIHIYDVLSEFCPKFKGFTEPTFLADSSPLAMAGALFIPYGTENEALQDELLMQEAGFIAGHFACDDVPFPGEHVAVQDLPNLPVFLGHYHTRGGNYIGATERFAWGEATNPTGVAVYDTDTQMIQFIDHATRPWVDITATAEEILDVLRGRMEELEGSIVRSNVTATPEEYHGLDIKAIREATKGALEFQIRRVGATETFTTDNADTTSYSLIEAWQDHVRKAKLGKPVKDMGSKALASAGVGE